ncbi:MAG: phosphate acetyltransferase [Nanoarchaeota archaeon]|nr:phosphate acetyltransferase [Nanoarchaeota archaeon]
MKGFMDNLKKKAKELNRRIVFPESEDERILKAVEIIKKKRFAVPILIGNPEEVQKKAKELKVKLDGIEIHDPKNFPDYEAWAKQLYEQRKNKGMSLEDAHKTLQDYTYFATMMVHMGKADGFVSGATHPTGDTLRPALQIIKTHEKFHKVSSFFIMLLKDKLLIFADCAVEIEPDAKDLAEIAVDTVRTAKKFGIEPRVAMLSFSTAGSAKHPLVDKVKEATAIAKDKLPDVIVEGDIQVDAALVPHICDKKYPGSKLKGDANVLIFPDLNSGNIAYKLVERLAGAMAIGPILQGLKKPVNDLSRGCSVQDVVDVAVITAVSGE